MDEAGKNFVRSVTAGGVVADHPPLEMHSALVGPATGDERNTLLAAIIPIACFRMDDVRFEFDSSFLLPEAAREMPELAKLREEHPGAPLSVFGHADPTGDDEYNKQLSGRRAQAFYGMLTRDAALWEDLHSRPFGGDKWGVKLTQIMLASVGHPPGPIDGVSGSKTTEAVKAFQQANGLTADGVAGPKTREKLFPAYMDVLCRDGAGQPFRVEKSEFLAQGADAGGKGDFQGCGEFNPLMMFSAEENARFEQSADKTERNTENTPNRRVLAFLFRPGSRVSPQRWPCPRAKEGTADCRRRFWSDATVRRQFQAQRRHFEETQDTFACRFYQRVTTGSPCEQFQPAPTPPPGVPVPPVTPPGPVEPPKRPPILVPKRPKTPPGPRPKIPIPVQTLVAGRLPSLFTLGKTFPKPSALSMVREVARRMTADASLRLLVIGHTDQSGGDDLNHALSLARAAAVRALLTGDAAFFRRRFDGPDPVHAWEWEEVQWMLSAVEIEGDPCYAGVVDGHYGSVTRRALGTFQIYNDLPVNYVCDGRTLTTLIARYLELIGPQRPPDTQIEVIGGGAWHTPREFGKGGKTLEGPEFEDADKRGFRRVEVFLSDKPFQPAPSACPPARHADCAAYRKWCDDVVEELSVSSRLVPIRIIDEYDRPVAKQPVSLFEHVDDSPTGSLVATLTTSDRGLIGLTAPPGLYSLSVSVQGEEHHAPLRMQRDEIGGLTVRLPIRLHGRIRLSPDSAPIRLDTDDKGD